MKRKHVFTVEATVHHVDGPVRDGGAVGDAIEAALAGETLELTTDDARARSRYLVDDVEILEEVER